MSVAAFPAAAEPPQVLPHSSSRRLRVLFLINALRSVGGAERFVIGLATNMPRDRVEPWVCSTRRAEDRAVRTLEAAGVPHVELGRASTWQLHRFRNLVSVLRRERFDVIHSHMFGSNLWGTLVGSACRVPVLIAHEHTWSYENDRLRLWLDGHVIGKLVTRFVAVSSADRERMISLEGIAPGKVEVMPVPHIPHDLTHGDIRAELGLDATVPLVVTAAVMRPQKALEVLLDAHALLLKRIPRAHLAIAGRGPCQPQLERQIERLGVGASVHLLGARHDVDAILRRADVGVMSSDFEGMPQFVFECMAAGTPFVSTGVGGLPEVVEDGRTGLLVPPRDPSALAAALERVLSDRQFAARLARAAAVRRDEFTIEAVASRYADLYHALVAEVQGDLAREPGVTAAAPRARPRHDRRSAPQHDPR